MRALLAALDAARYDFTTVTPASHSRVAARWRGLGAGPRDLFGWSRAVDPATLAPELCAAADAAGVLVPRDGGVAATVRVSRLAGRLFLHSPWPTEAADAVFLGPDSYRFAAFVAANLPPPRPGLRVIDIGTGSGIGGIVAADLLPGAALWLTDINAAALAMAAVNAAHAGVAARLVHGAGLHGVDDEVDVALANPPFLVDEGARAYRHGGGGLGTAVALAIAEEALGRLAPGGRFLLYTGTPIVDGNDALRPALGRLADTARATIAYREIDPDMFGEELARPAYGAVDRIAIVTAIVTRRG